MDIGKLHERINRQMAEASRDYGVPAERLQFGLHIFKPDSAKLETVVAVDIGPQDSETQTRSSIRFFYSPSLYGYASAARLEKDIQTCLESKTTR